MKENELRAAVSIQSTFLLAAILALGVAPQLLAAPFVVPNSLESTEGNSNNSYPFDISSLGLTTQRYQQVYAASEFGGPLLITQIAFRPDVEFGQSFTSELTNVQINLSTTAKNPGSLVTTFADNVGPDDTVVWPGGPLPLSSADTGGSPRDFDIVINLQIPFYYDPAQGNLLLDVRNFGGGVTTKFDAHEADPGTISRAFTYIGNVNSPTADIRWNAGLVTQFDSVMMADIDIKFCSNPNAFNCKNKGVVPVTIFGTDTFDVLDIDPSTLALCLASDLNECTSAPRDWSVYDRGAPGDLGLAACTIEETSPGSEIFAEVGNPDTYHDLDAAFDAREVRDILGVFCDEEDKGSSSEALVIIGETLGGAIFSSAPIPNIGVDQLVKANK